MNCTFCGSDAIIKNGFIKGIQRYYCKDCGANIQNKPRAQRDKFFKALVIELYLTGLNIGAIAFNLKVSHVAILKHLEKDREKLDRLRNKNIQNK